MRMRERIATPAEGMPPKRDAHRGAHPETAKSCLGTGEVENRHTVQIGETSGGGRAEAKSGTATAGAVPEPAKSFDNAAAMREALEKIRRNLTMTYQSEEEERDLIVEAFNIAGEALAAPPRNCDNYNTEAEAKSAFLAYWNKNYETDYDIGDLKHNVNGITQDYAEWLMEGATDGK